MLTLLIATAALAQDAPAEDRDLPASGWAVRPVGGPGAVTVGGMAAIGGSGGTQAATVDVRGAVGDWQLGARLPVVAWRGATAQDAGVGNLALEAWRPGRKGAIGVELVMHAGPAAWTWVYDATDVWPTTGVALAYQSTREAGALTLVGRGAFGLYGTRGYAPFPPIYARLSGALAADLALGDHAGLLAEGGVAYWDPSPLDVMLGTRVDPTDGIRARAAVVLPLTQWAGAGADQRITGIHEIGLAVDLTVGM